MSGFSQFIEKTKSANIVPVISSLSADLLTPLSVYLKLAAGTENSFLLESVEGGENLARFSFIGVDPKMIVEGGDHSVSIRGENGETERSISILAFLPERFQNHKVSEDSDLPSFIGGAIGYLGFSCAGWFEPRLQQSTPNSEGFPEASFMFLRSVIAFDHAKQAIKIISLVFCDETDGDIELLRSQFEAAQAENRRIKNILISDPIVLPKTADRTNNGEIKSNWERSDFENAVRSVKELIRAGECYQVVLSQCFSKRTGAIPVAVYRAIRSLNPSPYMFLLRLGDRSIVGASPEMLVRCRGNKLEYRPIAGTRPRGNSPEEDLRLAEEMRADNKETAEHLMLVDLGRNDLGRVAEFGSIKVQGLMSVEKYSHVQHLVSYLTGDLREDCDRFDALAACFPAGTVSGAPKVRAIEIINELEPSPRGVYAGAVGYFDYAGNMDTCIAIRTLTLENGVARIQAGAGIVADSVPELEYLETVNKAKALLRALEIAEERSL